jgi:hypothetical protein
MNKLTGKRIDSEEEFDYGRWSEKRLKMMDSEEDGDYGKRPAKRMKTVDSEKEEGKRRLLSLFSEFRTLAYLRHLNDIQINL